MNGMERSVPIIANHESSAQQDRQETTLLFIFFVSEKAVDDFALLQQPVKRLDWLDTRCLLPPSVVYVVRGRDAENKMCNSTKMTIWRVRAISRRIHLALPVSQCPSAHVSWFITTLSLCSTFFRISEMFVETATDQKDVRRS